MRAGDQRVVAGAEGTIFVTSAGNEGEPNPVVSDQLPKFDTTGEVLKRWVVVVATRADGMIWPDSNRCGVAAEYCLAAPGARVPAGRDSQGRSLLGSGTSYAAPLVSGGLALVKQRFGDALTMEEVLARVYETADEIGPAAIYGHGLMNLERATRPVGATTGHGRLADAGGGAIADALAGVEPVVFDSLGYPFRQPLGAQVVVVGAAPAVLPSFTEAAGAGRPSWAGLSWREAARAPDAAHTGAWAFAAATGGDGAIHSSGLAYAPHGGAWEAGWLAERDRVFGGRAEGTWAGGGFVHHTGFLRLRQGWTLAEGEAARLGVEWSSTVAHARMRGSGVLRETQGVYTGHRVALTRHSGDTRTAFSIEAPLRAETGTARVKVPVGGTLHTGVRYAERTAALQPEARELRLGASHTAEGRWGRLALDAQLRVNAGHRRDGRDWHAGLRWGYSF